MREMHLVRRFRTDQTRPVAEILESRTLLSAGLDPSFDGGLIERLNVPGQYAPAAQVIGEYSLAGDKTLIVVSGSELTTLVAGGIVHEPVLVRLDADGSPDSTFGQGGILIARSNSGRGYADNFDVTASAMQPDGKLVLFGTDGRYYTGGTKLVAQRLNADGTLDATFVYGGPTGGVNPIGAGLAITPSGNVYLASSSPAPNLPDFSLPVIYRLRPDGSLDTTFGTAGQITINETERTFDFGSLIATQGELPLVTLTGGLVSTLYRFRPDGSSDPAFGSGGSVVFDSLLNSTEPMRTLLPKLMRTDSSGRIVLVGSTTEQSLSPPSLSIWRLDASGHVDPAFAHSAPVLVSLAPRTITPESIGFTTDGKITVAAAVSAEDGRFDLGLVRLSEDSSLDSTIGAGGLTVSEVEFFRVNSATTTAEMSDLAVFDSAGRAVLARVGTDDSGGAQVVVRRVVPVENVPVIPTIVAFQPVVSKGRTASLQLTFNTAMNVSAANKTSYRVVFAGKDGRLGTKDDRTVPLVSAKYNPATRIVTLKPLTLLAKNRAYRVIALGSALADLAGSHLANNFVTDFRTPK